jgi:hypothetical protein
MPLNLVVDLIVARTKTLAATEPEQDRSAICGIVRAQGVPGSWYCSS